MKIRIFMLMCALILLGACASSGENESAFEIGSVTLISNGVEHEPGRHGLHSASLTESGGLMSASGVPFEAWIFSSLNRAPIIQYDSGNMQIVVSDGGSVGTGWEWNWDWDECGHIDEALDGVKPIMLYRGDFSDNIANVSLPDEPGIYLLYFDVWWGHCSGQFAHIRYLFKIEK